MIRVIVVDDSAVVRQIFQRELARDPEIEVVATAQDPFVARDQIVALNPDVITLDLEMPRMDGLTFLKRLMHYHPLPVIVVSSLTKETSELALEALQAGAVEILTKPGPSYSTGELAEKLVYAVKGASLAHLSRNNDIVRPNIFNSTAFVPNSVIAIGASAGGTIALEKILRVMPADAPGIVVALHMPEIFTRLFAERLDKLTELKVREAQDCDLVSEGQVLIAPGNMHMVLRRSAGRYRVSVKNGPRVNLHRPSVDVLFRSVAHAAGANAMGIILTGMGGDGAQGLLEMRKAGAKTLAQNEASCVVFGMPRVAIELGAVDEVIDLSNIPKRIIENLTVSS